MSVLCPDVIDRQNLRATAIALFEFKSLYQLSLSLLTEQLPSCKGKAVNIMSGREARKKLLLSNFKQEYDFALEIVGQSKDNALESAIFN